MEQTAAHLLINLKLKNGWNVIKKLERDASQSGSNFSVGYIVENENKEQCFLKAPRYRTNNVIKLSKITMYLSCF